jgi:glycosyltransferase involved in cell wall biosynthesis
MISTPLAVLIPVFNAEKHLPETLDSLLKQTFTDFTVIVCDDGSTDSTQSILKNYVGRFLNLRIIINPANQGIVKTRNRLLLEAKDFEFLAWIDSDDIASPDRFELQMAELIQNSKIGVVGGWISLFGHGYSKPEIRCYSADDKALRSKVFRYAPIANPCAMFRQEAVSKIGLMNVEFAVAEDLEFWFRLGEHYQFANVQKVLLHYRQHPASATFSKLAKIEWNTFRIRFRFLFSKAYHFGAVDLMFCVAQLLTAFLMTGNFRIRLFNYLRSKKLI